MANYYEPTQDQQRKYHEWVASRPDCVRKVAEQFVPWKLYWLEPSGHRVFVIGFFEDGTLNVCVSGEFNALAFERTVFGIRPEDLTECDLPGPGEPLGAALTDHDDIRSFMAAQQIDRN